MKIKKTNRAAWAVMVLVVLASGRGHGQATDMGKRMDAYLQRAVAHGFSGAVLVAKGEEVLLTQGLGLADREAKRPETDKTVFSIGSITKQFTAAAILKLETMGKLTVADKLGKFFPEMPADKAGISLHQLLTHSAGFPGAIGDDYDAIGSRDFVKLASQAPLRFEPGSGYLYSNVGYSLLGIIVEQVSGKGYEAFLAEQFFVPLGMRSTGYLLPGFKAEDLAVGYQNGNRWGTALDRPWAKDGPGWHLRANGGILSTVGDMHRWCRALLSNQALPAAATLQMFSQHVREGEDAPSFYGYGWVVQDREDSKRIIWHNGGNGVYNAFVGFVPADGTVVVVSSNSNDKISDDLARHLQSILDGDETPLLSDDFIKAYSQRYQLPSGAMVGASFDENNELTLRFSEAGAIPALLADGTESAERVDFFNKKAKNILEHNVRGDFAPIAEAIEVPVAEAEATEGPFWAELQERNGAVQSVEVLGTVARAGSGHHLTFSKIHCERSDRFMMYVWGPKGFLIDMQVMKEMEKKFVHWGPVEFFAPNNMVSVLFETPPGGKPQMIVLTAKEGERLTAPSR